MTYTISRIRTAHDRMMGLFIKELAKLEGEVRCYGRTSWSPYAEVNLDSAEDCHYMAKLAGYYAIVEYPGAKRRLAWNILWRYNKRVE